MGYFKFKFTQGHKLAFKKIATEQVGHYTPNMLRITETESSLYVSSIHGQSQYKQVEDLPEDIRKKYFMLRATDPGTYIKGVGRHMKTGHNYWVEEFDGDKAGDGDDGKQVSFVTDDVYNTGKSNNFVSLIQKDFDIDYGHLL